jgi:hypothetical protein
MQHRQHVSTLPGPAPGQAPAAQEAFRLLSVGLMAWLTAAAASFALLGRLSVGGSGSESLLGFALALGFVAASVTLLVWSSIAICRRPERTAPILGTVALFVGPVVVGLVLAQEHMVAVLQGSLLLIVGALAVHALRRR